MIFVFIVGGIIFVFAMWGNSASPAAKISASSEGNTVQVFGLVVLLIFIALILIMAMGVK